MNRHSLSCQPDQAQWSNWNSHAAAVHTRAWLFSGSANRLQIIKRDQVGGWVGGSEKGRAGQKGREGNGKEEGKGRKAGKRKRKGKAKKRELMNKLCCPRMALMKLFVKVMLIQDMQKLFAWSNSALWFLTISDDFGIGMHARHVVVQHCPHLCGTT